MKLAQQVRKKNKFVFSCIFLERIIDFENFGQKRYSALVNKRHILQH